MTCPDPNSHPIAITGAIQDSAYSSGSPEHGAGIWVDKALPVSLLVTDCYLYCNATAILVDAMPEGNVSHSIWLINNTFAFNACGIWNGEIHRGAPVSTISVGRSHLSLINNVFDTSPPITYPSGPATAPVTEIPLPHPSGARPIPEWWSRWKTAMEMPRTGGLNLLWKAVPATGGGFIPASVSTAFEGIDADDLEGFPATVRENFNAYESIAPNASPVFRGPTNTSANYFPLTPEATVLLTYLGLHRTTERTQVAGVSVRPTPPTRNLSPFTNKETDGSLGRGILFVRDLMHEGGRITTLPFVTPGTAGNLFDLCVGDFRLSPGSREAGLTAAVQGTPPDRLNPLVDNGFAFIDAAGNYLLTMANGGIVWPDVIDLGSDDLSFASNPWEWDVEGYGNPRVFDHPVYPNNGLGGEYTVDLGADELNLLVIAGYRDGTTTFIGHDPSTGGPLTGAYNDFQWYLCASSGLAGADPAFPATGTPPTVPVFASPLGSPLRSMAASATAVQQWTIAGWQPTPPPSTSFYAATYVDVIPYLLPDIHPWHPAVGMNRMQWQTCVSGVNAFLYTDPVVGIINPVGTYLDLSPTTPNIQWLDLDLTGAPGVWLGSQLDNDTALNGGWCYLAISQAPSYQQPTQFPSWGAGTNALRISCEWFPASGLGAPWFLPDSGNVQSFMVWR